MIDDIIHFYYKDLSHPLRLQLPYRLIHGDLVHAELLENRGELEFDDDLIVGKLEIDHKADAVAWFNIPEE